MSEQERKVGMDECRSVLTLDGWKTAQEVAVALGHQGGSAEGAAVMARGCMHSLVQCKMAEAKPREQASKKGGRAPIEFRLTAHGADKSAPPPPAAMRKSGAPSKSKSAKKRRLYEKPAMARTAPATVGPKPTQEITTTLFGGVVVLIRIPDRVSVDTLRALLGVAEFHQRQAGRSEYEPFLPLAVAATK
jgi:hypothetical protein